MLPALPALPCHFLHSECSQGLLLSPVAKPLQPRAAQSPASGLHSPPRQSMPKAAPHAQPHETAPRKPPPESALPAIPHSPYCTLAFPQETHPFPFSQTNRTSAAAASYAVLLPAAACRKPLCPAGNSNAQNHPHPAVSCSTAYSSVARGPSRGTAQPGPPHD